MEERRGTHSIECFVETEVDVTPGSFLEVSCRLDQAIREWHGTEDVAVNIQSVVTPTSNSLIHRGFAIVFLFRPFLIPDEFPNNSVITFAEPLFLFLPLV